MNRYLVIVKPDLNSETTVEQTLKADGFDRTDFDILFWRNDFLGKKVSYAFYQAIHVICILPIGEER